MQAAVPSAEASRYVFKNESIQPFSPFHVKVGVYNNEGEGPFGPAATIYSAEEGAVMSYSTHHGVAPLDQPQFMHHDVTRSKRLNSHLWSCSFLSAFAGVSSSIIFCVCCPDERNASEVVLMIPLWGVIKAQGNFRSNFESSCINSRAWPSAHQGSCQEPLCIWDWSLVESSALECQQEKSAWLWGELQWNTLFVSACVCVHASTWQLMLLNLVLFYYWWVFQAHAPWA